MNGMNDMRACLEWAGAKQVRDTYGITISQIRRFAEQGMIRSANIRRPGRTRGIRLFSVHDLERLIESSIELRGGGLSVN